MLEQGPLLNEMIRDNVDGRIIKICSMGLNDGMLGKGIA
jgi:diphthamide synthase (EF-2-diphthine--ammonia ligase)